MRVELTLYIDYDSGDFDDIEQQLYFAAEHLYDNGLLSGNGPSISIESCTHSVTLVSHVPTYNWNWDTTGPEGEKK